MDEALQKKAKNTSTGLSDKRRNVKKPWWNDILGGMYKLYNAADEE